MHIITLTSDWNENDYYVASLKGKILSSCPEVRIVDINHKVKPFNTAQAAFVVRNRAATGYYLSYGYRRTRKHHRPQ